MRGFDEQLRCRKVVLEAIVQGQPIHWLDIINGTIEETGGSNKSQRVLDWLRKNGYVRRIKRGVYEMTPKGSKLLAGLNNPCSPELTGHEELRKEQKARGGKK